MDQRLQATTGREYIDFEPGTTTIQEEDREILLVYLPGFDKKLLNIKLNPDRTLSVTGEQVENDKWRRFRKKYPVPANCDTDRIEAKFDTDTLHITLPKLTLPPKKTPSDAPLPQTNGPDVNSVDSSAQGTASMPSTDQPQQPNNKADEPKETTEKPIKEERKNTKETTEKPITDEPQKPGSAASMNMFLVALLVLALGFFASNWFGKSDK